MPATRGPGRWRVPFNRPCVAGRELEYVSDAMQSGHLSGDGPYTKRCQQLLETIVGSPKAFLTTSGTHALELAALLLDIGAGDEIVAPSFTFPSTVNAFVLRGARPVFADVRPDTLNIDETKLEPLLGERTRAIVVVHYAGVGCEMKPILALAEARGIAIVEDNAHGLFGSYRGRPLGSFGVAAAQSFHETKNVSCGEGGALLINDPALTERAEIVREKGTDRARFFRGQVERYTWVDIGSSYLPSDILAAFLLGQLEARERIQAKRRHIWDCYRDGLHDWAAAEGVRLPTVPAHCEQPAHLFYLLLPSPAAQEAFIAHLGARGILTVFHYLPLHLSRMGRSCGGRAGDCPVTEDVSERLVRLPLYYDLSETDQSYVIDTIRSFRA